MHFLYNKLYLFNTSAICIICEIQASFVRYKQNLLDTSIICEIQPLFLRCKLKVSRLKYCNRDCGLSTATLFDNRSTSKYCNPGGWRSNILFFAQFCDDRAHREYALDCTDCNQIRSEPDECLGERRPVTVAHGHDRPDTAGNRRNLACDFFYFLHHFSVPSLFNRLPFYSTGKKRHFLAQDSVMSDATFRPGCVIVAHRQQEMPLQPNGRQIPIQLLSP